MRWWTSCGGQLCRFPLRRWTVASVFRCVHGQLRRCSEALADRSVGGRLSMDSCVCVSFSLRVTLCSSTCVVLCVRRTSALRFLFVSFVFHFSLLRCVAPALFFLLSFALALSLFASPFAVFLLFCVSLRGWIVFFNFFLRRRARALHAPPLYPLALVHPHPPPVYRWFGGGLGVAVGGVHHWRRSTVSRAAHAWHTAPTLAVGEVGASQSGGGRGRGGGEVVGTSFWECLPVRLPATEQTTYFFLFSCAFFCACWWPSSQSGRSPWCGADGSGRYQQRAMP